MRSKPTLALAGSLALLLSCACRSACSGDGAEPAPPAEPGDVAREPLSQEVLLRGDGGTFSGFEVRLVREELEWRDVWARIAGRQLEPPAAPEVDFARTTLVLLALGERPSTGYGLELRALERRGASLFVHARETRPAPDSMQAQVLTSPYLVLAVPRHDGPLQLLIE